MPLSLLIFTYWAYLTRKRQHHRNYFVLTKEEYYFLLFQFTWLAGGIWSSIALKMWPSVSWEGISVNLLVSYAFFPMVFVVIATGDFEINYLVSLSLI